MRPATGSAQDTPARITASLVLRATGNYSGRIAGKKIHA
jgi:hypothetical protein